MSERVRLFAGNTHIKAIFSPYATLATMGLSDRNVKRRFLTAYGKGATTTQKVTICFQTDQTFSITSVCYISSDIPLWPTGGKLGGNCVNSKLEFIF